MGTNKPGDPIKTELAYELKEAVEVCYNNLVHFDRLNLI
jgi:hypothetical protein